MYTKQQFAKLIDFTLLKPMATEEQIEHFCREARHFHFATAVLFPAWVPMAVRELKGSDVKVCTVVGFPHGASTRSTKTFESRNAVANGAEEIDVVINIGALKSGDTDRVARELQDIIGSPQISGVTPEARRVLVKVIIETPYLTNEEKITACKIAVDAGADFIKTSTGTAPNGATAEDVQLIRDAVGPGIGIKAAGGIRTIEHAMDLLDAGANRIGTSAGIVLLQGYDPDALLKASK